MGYDLASLVNEVDDEFLCSICTMVLENSVLSPCEHAFCYDCINGWLEVNPSCPVDSCSITMDDMKPPPRLFRNLLDKLKVKCNFEPQGCQSIVPLEQLQHHLTECVFNANAAVICDKGCNIKITLGEYEGANCFTHLANRQQKQQEHFDKITSQQEEEITKLNDELNRQRVDLATQQKEQKEEIMKLNDKIDRQRDQISKLNDELSSVRSQVTHSESVISQQREEITKLIDEVSRIYFEVEHQREEFTKLSGRMEGMQREEISKLSDELGRQREDVTELSGKDSVQREEKNMKNSIDQLLILEHVGNHQLNAFAQTFNSLEPTTPAIKIKVLNTNDSMTIGLTTKGHSANTILGLSDKSIDYCSNGRVGKLPSFLAVGGSTGSVLSIEKYDSKSNSWSMFHEIPANLKCCCSEIVGNQLFVIGGIENGVRTNKTLCLSLDCLKHEHKDAMTVARSSFATVVLENCIYAIGGLSRGGFIPSVERYNINENKWSVVASMSSGRTYHSAVVLSNKIYVVGGHNGLRLASVECYNPETNIWSAVASMNVARCGLSCCVVNGYIYAVGGYDGSNVLQSIEKYDEMLNKWIIIDQTLAILRSSFGIAIHQNWIYACGGNSNKCLEKINVATGERVHLSSMNQGRSFYQLLRV